MELSVGGRMLALFLYILCLHGFAILLFTRGFLLTRTELPLFSTCDDVRESPCCPMHTGQQEEVYQDLSGVLTEEARKIHQEITVTEGMDSQSYIPNPEKNKVNNTGVEEGNKDAGLKTHRGFTQSLGECTFTWHNESFAGSSRGMDERACWTKPAIKRAIIIIIDALRFDFVAKSNNFAGEPQPWMDKLRVLQRLEQEEGRAARIFKFVADPPTTTLQRLKGLTTGGLPTFVDIGHSFGAPAIVEDNLILQLVRRGKKVRMMGDDTWMQLFPSHFAEAHPFPSFNVKDLHTVDDGVIREIFPALLQPDWDVLIAHFLGVDHVGHIFGVESPLMVSKLEQYNSVIEEVVAVLKKESGPAGLHEDTLLVVMGDHGQTLHGDHGGGTSEEVETALFAMGLRNPPSSLPPDLRSSPCNRALDGQDGDCISTFPQLDFSATLAALLGLPLPYGSVGRVNPELYALAAGTWPSTSTAVAYKGHGLPLVLDWMERYKDVLCINSWQVQRYLEAYSASTIQGFQETDFSYVQNLYANAQSLASNAVQALKCSMLSVSPNNFGTAANGSNIDAELLTQKSRGLTKQILHYFTYLDAAADLARAQWTQFEDDWMAVGLSLLGASVVVHLVALSRTMGLSIWLPETSQREPEVCNRQPDEFFASLFPFKRMLLGCGLTGLVTTGMLWGYRVLAAWKQFGAPAALSNGQSTVVVFGTILLASIMTYVCPILKHRGTKTSFKTSVAFRSNSGCKQEEGTHEVKQQGVSMANLKSITALLFVGVHAGSFLSNSYLVGEGQVVSFLLASSGILYLRQALQAGSKVPQALLFLALNGGMASVMLAGIFKDPATARDPATKDNHSLASCSLKQFITLSVVALTTTALPLSALMWLILRRANKFQLYSRSLGWTLNLGVPLGYILIVLHWFIMDLAASLIIIPEAVKEFARLLFPQLVYSISLGLVFVTFAAMRMSSTKGGVTVPIGGLLVEAIVAVLTGLSGTIILLLGRKGPTIALLAVLEVWSLLDLQGLGSPSKREIGMDKGGSEAENIVIGELEFGSRFAAVVDWNLVAVQLFFCTGHRCTFDGLHYTAAFIGFDNFHFYRQGALLAADTFGASHILPVIGLPLLVTTLGMSPWNIRSSMSKNDSLALEITKVYVSYGLVCTILMTMSMAAVTLHRRHLMVWGLFAPKYVFDAVGLLIVDIFIVLAMSFYLFLQPGRETETSNSNITV